VEGTQCSRRVAASDNHAGKHRLLHELLQGIPVVLCHRHRLGELRLVQFTQALEVEKI